jgi:DNA-binding transcriptional LysR family regulator
MLDFNALAILVKVVELGSFTQAAEALGMTKSTVSRKVSDLERNLGVRLITRSTRSLKLTAEGERFYQSCLLAKDIMEQAEVEITAHQELIQGDLNVVMPVELGHQVLGPYINEFIKLHPHIRVHLEMSNREVDIIGEGIDLYAQVGTRKDSNLVSRLLTNSTRVVAASPAYLAETGMVQSPTDLRSPHRQVKVYNQAVKLLAWELFDKQGQSFSIDLPYQLRVNTITASLQACLDGLGIAVLPTFLCRPHFESGRLVQLLSNWQMPTVPISLVYANRTLMPKRLRTLIDYLVTRLNEDMQQGVSATRID